MTKIQNWRNRSGEPRRHETRCAHPRGKNAFKNRRNWCGEISVMRISFPQPNSDRPKMAAVTLVLLSWLAASAAPRPKGCGNLALPKNTIVIWSAPFLSGGGYCSEVMQREGMRRCIVESPSLSCPIQTGNNYLTRFARMRHPNWSRAPRR